MDPEPDVTSPIACTLGSERAADQLLEWGQLHQHAKAVEPIEHGVRMTFNSDLSEIVNDLARREAACCSFLTISTQTEDGLLRLDVTSENPDAAPVIAMLTGAPER